MKRREPNYLEKKRWSSYTSAIINPTRTGLGLKLYTRVDGRRQSAQSTVFVMDWKISSCLIKSRLMNTFLISRLTAQITVLLMAWRPYSYLITLRLMITFEGANHFGKEHLAQCNLQFDLSFGSF